MVTTELSPPSPITDDVRVAKFVEKTAEIARASSANKTSKFGPLSISSDFSELLLECGYKRPMPIQKMAMHEVAKGVNVVIHAATGSGKTLAFLVPLIAQIQPEDALRVVVMVPSQELAIQISAEASRLLPSQDASKPRVVLAISSTEELETQQENQLFGEEQVAKIVVGTPQRLLDLSRNRGARRLFQGVGTLVLDEVDLMIPPSEDPAAAPKSPKKDEERAPGHKMSWYETDRGRRTRITSKKSGRSKAALESGDPSTTQRPPPGANAKEWYLLQQQIIRRKSARKPAELFFEKMVSLRARSASPLQVISCSATITPNMRRKIGVMVGGKGKNAAGKVVTAAPLHTTANHFKKFGVGGVQLPSTLKHTAYIGDNVDMMLQVALEECNHDEEGGFNLLVVPNGKSVAKEIERLEDYGHKAVALQDALGVPSMAASIRGSSEEAEAHQDVMLNKRSDLAGKFAKRELMPLIVTNEHSARGMDLKGIDAVIVLGIPQHVESYIHVVGRTAREGRKGKAFYMLSELDQMQRLNDFRKKLGMKIEEVDLRFL
jgi:superfamily II DNA/RNA helicase